ncbi:helix-turn-helix domain-containing protein [Pseudarthrobacter sp. PS3-L1]|uniref:helix-turn-helix domain-containing protein n=1 Tax=Pseudarthrobacter sp. PS3-L1 TaxID=3046207 RepID=UPI0024BBEB24|nr:helix-turn-helix domain-containing protein [Pseudarthrobacter sp. PS3-L1]MDJ0319791.1 helix-turn-helix domain-containing protein [Pseudarthrobacter sp. PS3-L1]
MTRLVFHFLGHLSPIRSFVFPEISYESEAMISGEQIRSAREASGLTQQELAKQLGVTLRTVGNWERGESVPRNREPAIRQLLARYMGAKAAVVNILDGATDMELLAEIARRMARADVRATANSERLPKRPEDYRLAAREQDSEVGIDQMPNET